MTPGPTLETARLLLRPIQAEDFDGWAEMMGDPERPRFIGGPQSRPAAWRGFLTMAGAWSIQGYSMFSMIEKATGEWIGRTGPWQPEGWPGTEVGWGVTASAAGKGFAYEAAVASIGWAFDSLGWTDVIHCIDPENTPSQRLAERLGSSNRGPGKLPPPFEHFPVDVWGQTREQWRARPR